MTHPGTDDPQDRHEEQDDEATVSEPEADPTPPAVDPTTAEDVDDTPQTPTRRDVAEQ